MESKLFKDMKLLLLFYLSLACLYLWVCFPRFQLPVVGWKMPTKRYWEREERGESIFTFYFITSCCLFLLYLIYKFNFIKSIFVWKKSGYVEDLRHPLEVLECNSSTWYSSSWNALPIKIPQLGFLGRVIVPFCFVILL